MTTVHELIETFFDTLSRSQDRVGIADEATKAFVAAVRELAAPEREIADALESLVVGTESRAAQLWLIAAQIRPCPSLVEPLCRILVTPNLRLSYESVVEALCPLRDTRAIPALMAAFDYELDFDPGRAMQSSILSLLAETDATGCESFFRKAAEDDRDDNVRRTARGVLAEMFGAPEFEGES